MRIVCPSCTAAYEVPGIRLAPGKKVRCARCSTDWTPVAEPLPPALPPAPELPPELPAPGPVLVASAAERLPAPPPPRRDRAVAIGWALSIALLAAAAVGAYAGRDEVMRAWPASERAYQALGLASRL